MRKLFAQTWHPLRWIWFPSFIQRCCFANFLCRLFASLTGSSIQAPVKNTEALFPIQDGLRSCLYVARALWLHHKLTTERVVKAVALPVQECTLLFDTVIFG